MVNRRWPTTHCSIRRRPVRWCVTLMAACSLFVTFILVFSLADEAGGAAGRMRSIKLVQNGGHRTILDAENDIKLNTQVPVRDVVELIGAVDVTGQPSSEAPSATTRRPARPTTDCKGPWPGYPKCSQKMRWMEEYWKTEECYARSGVNGSLCSFQIYLSEMEVFCPRLPEREEEINLLQSRKQPATLHYEVEGLLMILDLNPKFTWISSRIQRLWPQWSAALKTLEAQQPFTHASANVLIHIGALSDKAGFKFAENAGKGGPLGELVQWSDLIASLYALGYNLDFSTETFQLQEYLTVNNRGGCPTSSELTYATIFVDIVGLKQMRKLTRNRFPMYKCLLRVLDTFGTEPVFNYKKWKPEKDTSSHDYGRAWGNWELNPRQFMTMYPHTPDNSFLGFAVEVHNSSLSPLPSQHSEASLVYGKELYMWEGREDYLAVVAKYFDVYATIGTTTRKKEELNWSVVPSFVHNRGILDGMQLSRLLQLSRVFVGLGFPYEGPAPLESVAQGCVFLNPTVDPPVNRANSKFFEKKPTNRKIDSQNPYMEMFVGEPYVYTINTENLTEVDLTLQRILKKPRPPPYIPYEFTFAGMLERITAYLKNQQYCHPHQWPPLDTLIPLISRPGHSCKDACYDKGLVCEPELFPLLNTEEALASNGIQCNIITLGPSTHGPSLLTTDSSCSLQTDNLLLSCAGSQERVKRLCPCREYREGQVALCLTCSR